MVEEAKAANNGQPAMGKVDPPSEERLSLAAQGNDQLRGELQAQLATYAISHDTPANDVRPVGDDLEEAMDIDAECTSRQATIELTELEDRSRDITVAHEDWQSDKVTKITTEDPEEGEGAFQEASSFQRAQAADKTGHGLIQTPGDAVDKIVQQQEQTRGGAHGVGAPATDRLEPPGAEEITIGGPVTQSSGKKDPPWLPDPLPVEARAHTSLPGAASVETYMDSPCQLKVSVNSAGEAEAAEVTTERGAKVGESPDSGNSGGKAPKKTRSEKLAARLEKLKEEKGKAMMLQTSCLLYTSPSPRDLSTSRMPSSA